MIDSLQFESVQAVWEVPASPDMSGEEMGQHTAGIGRSGAPRRRRTASTEPLQKMSFQLHSSVAEAIRGVVNAGEAPSANVFVEEAVKLALRERRRERVYAAYAEAAQDKMFMAEMIEAEQAFRSTMSDGAQ